MDHHRGRSFPRRRGNFSRGTGVEKNCTTDDGHGRFTRIGRGSNFVMEEEPRNFSKREEKVGVAGEGNYFPREGIEQNFQRQFGERDYFPKGRKHEGGRGYSRRPRAGQVFQKGRGHVFPTDHHNFPGEGIEVEQRFPMKEESFSVPGKTSKIQGNVRSFNRNSYNNTPSPSFQELPHGFQPHLLPPAHQDQQVGAFLRRDGRKESDFFRREGAGGNFSRRRGDNLTGDYAAEQVFQKERKHTYQTNLCSFSGLKGEVEQTFPIKEESFSESGRLGYIHGSLRSFDEIVNTKNPPPSLLDLPYDFQPNVLPPTTAQDHQVFYDERQSRGKVTDHKPIQRKAKRERRNQNQYNYSNPQENSPGNVPQNMNTRNTNDHNEEYHTMDNSNVERSSQFNPKNNLGNTRKTNHRQRGKREYQNKKVQNEGHSSKKDLGNTKESRMYTQNPNLCKSNSSIISIPINLYNKDDTGSITDVNRETVNTPDLFFDEENENSKVCNEKKIKEEITGVNAQGYDDNETPVNDNKHSIDNNLSIDNLNDLLNMDPDEIIQILSKKYNYYSNILKEYFEPKMFLLVIEILSKICDASPSSDRGDILRQASLPMFLDQIFNFISEFPFTEDKEICGMGSKFFENIVLFYETLMDLMPSAVSIFRVHLLEVEKSVRASSKNLGLNINPDTVIMIKSLLSETNNTSHEIVKEDNTKQSGKKKDIFFPDPVGDFRTVSLFPRPEDVFSEQPFLYPNVVEGPFASIDQYLDIHFKLLREDFMSPIRQALRDYKKQSNTNNRFQRIDNVRIYRKVKFLHPKTIYDKVGYEICFDVDKKLNRVNWEFCSRFMFGSLLLFTADSFDTFFLATVANRNVKELEDKRVTVELQGTLPNAKSILGKIFVMAESEAYFEPYFHVLKALQRFNETNFPLAKYIVDVNNETDHPMYLTQQDRYTIKTADRVFTFGVLNDWEWPTHEDLNLDHSQYGAYKAAITNDIVVIQGPPGTGKTFLGLQIAKTLLQNSTVWNNSSSPILVVCFTNHALDQFLEGLLHVTNKLVRIGGKSKGSELDKFNIRERRREYSYYKKTQARSIRELNSKMSSVFAEIKIHQNNLQLFDDTNGILSWKTLQLVTPDNQANYFRDDDSLLDWLLVGVGNKETKVKITVTADKGIVKETSEINSSLDNYEDQFVRQVFFDTIDFDAAAKPSEDMVKIFFACDLKSIANRLKKITDELNSKKNIHRNRFLELKSISSSLETVLQHLRNGLKESNYLIHDIEKNRLLSEVFLGDLQPVDRWKLYHTWVNILRNGLITELENKNTEFRKYAFEYDQLRQMDDIQILRTSHVVGTTTTLAAKYQPMFESLAPKIVIVEEAAEVLEAHIIASLTQSCQHLILIGDHKQLRPNVAEVRLSRQYKLDVSLFERMVINGLACHTLTLQHRMRPEISQQLVPTIYPSLKDHESVRDREPIKGMDKNVFFMTHKHFEDEVVEITSKRNQFEAEIALHLARHLVLQGYSSKEITILATYKGQMYHMKNEIKKMIDFPRGIQITVVDNFQGEENRIIILSLVRSNAMKKIGFLSIENRVCVALSRARDGMYVIGNMDIMVASSDIWPHIKNSFLRQGAYGSALQLRCQIHKEKVTSITCSEDFRKVSEGGCSEICGQELPCSHTCKSMCHLGQDYHQRYKCKEPCQKILCNEGHQCPGKCYMKCGECKVLIQRDLPCGHAANVPCYLDIRNFQCKEMVEVLAPLCNHSVTLECHGSAYPECNLPCFSRLNCGHSCEKTCHVDDDPEHIQYICSKPCSKLKEGCSEDHKCQLLCFEKCDQCMALVDKILPCEHSIKTVCSADILSIKCQKKCKRTQPCGHPCKKKCWEPCYPCPVAVEKIVPECDHTIKVACSQPPSKEWCNGACNVQLTCGHKCVLRCKETCSADFCEVPKHLRMTFTRMPCGHKNVVVPCNKSSLVKSLPVEEQMQYCSQPCNQQLACSHLCSGTCGECIQGRIHKVCDKDCGKVLICGHSCNDPCSEVCPPCDKVCRHECKHSKCPRKCGQPCVPCKERCDYQCPHLKCKKYCWELCDRKPCYENCPKLLDCSHACVGFCGEPCPPCRQCEPHHFDEFFHTGEETEADAKWVYLEDCKHTFESSGLEYWLNMKQESREIVAKACPLCKTPIVKVQRFMNLIKKTYTDIQEIKERCFGNPEEIRIQRHKALRKLQEIHFVSLPSHTNEPDELEILFGVLKNELPEVSKQRRKEVDAKKVHLLCFQTEFFISLYKRKLECWDIFTDESKSIISNKINLLTSLLKQRQKKISDQVMKSFELELKRIHRLFDLLTYTDSYEYRVNLASKDSAININKNAEKIIYSPVIYDETVDKQMIILLSELKKLIKSSREISTAERSMIHAAMAASFHSVQKTGHWFKCKNGHIYCITECGGAMEKALCPMSGCGERIGGANHALLQDQALASEMDGARYAAWSDQNNMANFGFH